MYPIRLISVSHRVAFDESRRHDHVSSLSTNQPYRRRYNYDSVVQTWRNVSVRSLAVDICRNTHAHADEHDSTVADSAGRAQNEHCLWCSLVAANNNRSVTSFQMMLPPMHSWLVTTNQISVDGKTTNQLRFACEWIGNFEKYQFANSMIDIFVWIATFGR